MFTSLDGSEIVRCRDELATGCENGLIVLEGEMGDRELSLRLDGGRTGEAGAYISASWDNEVGSVRAERSCRTLSHCVCVVCSEDCRAIRRADDGAWGLVGP